MFDDLIFSRDAALVSTQSISRPGINSVSYLGQAGFLVNGEKGKFLIDPYLSNAVDESDSSSNHLFKRQFPPPVMPVDLVGIDYVFITHAHGDHCDPQTLRPILDNCPGCKFIGPPEAVKLLIEQGFPPGALVMCKPDIVHELPGIQYQAIPAAHYQLELDENGYSRYLSYLIQFNGFTFFHAGDTILYDGYINRIRQGQQAIDIGFIPVNGRDRKREELGIIGNLNPQEALELTEKIKVKLMIPMHNDLFTCNQASPMELNCFQNSSITGLTIKWMVPGERLFLRK